MCDVLPQWGGDGPVPVQRQDEQVEDGGSGGGVVGRQEELAHRHAKFPVW